MLSRVISMEHRRTFFATLLGPDATLHAYATREPKAVALKDFGPKVALVCMDTTRYTVVLLFLFYVGVLGKWVPS